MSLFELDTTESLDSAGGTFLKEEGFFHFNVLEAVEGHEANKPDVKIVLEVMAGTVPGQEGKKFEIPVWAPDLSRDEDSIERTKRFNTALFVALGLFDPNDLGKSASIEIEKAIGRQLVAEIARKMEKDSDGKYTKETKFFQVAFNNMFHVDDPEVKDVPKNVEALKYIDAAQRHDESWFSFKKKRGSNPSKASADSASKSESPKTELNDDIF